MTATLAIYDTMQFLECPINTYCMGLAASGAAIILAAGTKGKRYALPNSKVMVHQPWGQVPYAQVSDIEITANEFMKDRQRLNEILAKHTGQPIEMIEKETERDRFFDAGRSQNIRHRGRRAAQGERYEEVVPGSRFQVPSWEPGNPSGIQLGTWNLELGTPDVATTGIIALDWTGSPAKC